MDKVWGWVVIQADGTPLCGPYGDVLLFKHHADADKQAKPTGIVKRVVTARVPASERAVRSKGD